MNRAYFFTFLIFLGSLPSGIQAQGCCGIGSSLIAGGHPTLKMGTLFVQPGGEFLTAENPSRYKTGGTVNLAYGITNRLALSIKTGYTWLHSSVLQKAVVYNGTVLFPETTIVFDNNGFGDGMVGAQFSIIPLDVVTRQELKIGADVGLPWAPDQKKINGNLLPKNMQTGSGGYTLGAFISYNKAFPEYRLAGTVSAAGRLKFKNRRKESPGNEAGFLGSVIAGPFWITHESVSLNYKTTEATYDVNGTKETATAGSRVDIIPAIEFDFTENIKATVDAEVPVWRDVYQIKSGNKFSASASMLFFIPMFSFFGGESTPLH